MTTHHPIFSRFPVAQNTESEDFFQDMTGANYRRYFVDAPVPDPLPDGTDPICLPAFDEEYFEWIDCIEAVEQSGDTFTVIELGAGYGRWAIRCVAAARRLGKTNCRAIAVEAEPIHYRWLEQAFADNDMTGEDFILHEAAINGSGEPAHFYIQPPEDQEQLSADKWYGQAMAGKSHDEVASEVPGDYEGKKIFTAPNGWKTIEVPALTLNQILAGETVVDIIDMDVQGAEAGVIAASIDAVNEKVKRLHIGTHSSKIDAELIQTLSEAGWKNTRTYLCGQMQETPYGEISFQDGVQTWINPKFN